MVESRFQSFETTGDSSRSGERVAALRAELQRRDLAGFVVPRADEQQNEYVPDCAERLSWLTGFTGSAGLAIVLLDRVALFVDGRYTIQAQEQLDLAVAAPVALSEESIQAWLAAHLPAKTRLGYDPWLHTPAQAERLQSAARAADAELTPTSPNPLDAVWQKRPPPPMRPVRLHPLRYAGEKTDAKLVRIVSALKGQDALLVSDPHALAWMFNIRGGDVSHTPIALGWAIIHKSERPDLYLAGDKLEASVRAHLTALANLREPAQIDSDVAQLGKRRASVLFDQATAPSALVRGLESEGGRATLGADPIALMKACKNPAELRGTRAAHVRDGVALTRFLCWFADHAPGGKLTEISAAEALENFRAQSGKLKDLSFPTISAFGAHGALPHYRVTHLSDRRIGRGLYLVDSGAQYEDGTTDVTRTIAIGAPSKVMRDRFTRVLKGHIAIARLAFPAGVSGAQIDAFARRALWEVGLDFDHGTGHGVGSYLSVHEGPQRISKLGATPLMPGMILSNEPAYYSPGRWGIRIENLLVVERRKIKAAEKDMFGFETITLAPIDLTLVDPDLMSQEEIDWLDTYHAHVRKTLSPLLEAKTRKWLAGATKRVSLWRA